ncbi:MAG: Ig-like domain-containing protein [Nitrososphaerota archaeon]|nr:Ig-like domain-containing protein [Nitrososphaerota archaeon]
MPSKVVVQPIFSTVLADGAQHQTLQVTLEDSLGNPAVTSALVNVYLSSSQVEVAKVVPELPIPAGQFSGIANVTTSAAAGTANITAYANFNTYLNSSTTGYSFSSTLLNTVVPSPSAIAAYMAPSSYVATRPQTKASLVVQLQDASGNPARARAETNVTITSSNAGVQNATLVATIEQGDDYAVVSFVPIGPGSTKFTAFASGFTPATTQLQTYASGFAAQLSASPPTILANETATLTLTVTLDGQGLRGATVQWTAKNGDVSPAKSTTNPGGQATAIFTPLSSGAGEVEAVFSSPAFGADNLTTTLVVSQAVQRASPGLLETLTSFPYILVFPAAAVAALLGFVLLRRRGRKVEEITDEGYVSSSG